MDDGFGGGDDDVGNSVFGGLGGRLALGGRGGFGGRRGGGGFRGGFKNAQAGRDIVVKDDMEAVEEGELVERDDVSCCSYDKRFKVSVEWDSWDKNSFESRNRSGKSISWPVPVEVQASFFDPIRCVEDQGDLVGDQAKLKRKLVLEECQFKSLALVSSIDSSFEKDGGSVDCGNLVSSFKRKRMENSVIDSGLDARPVFVRSAVGKVRPLSYDWQVCVSKWKELLLEPGSLWGVTPSFWLFCWWMKYFEMENTRLSIEADYNWWQVEIFRIEDTSDKGDTRNLERLEPQSDASLLFCGTVDYYSQFENSDYEEVVHSYHRIKDSVRRCLEGDLERIAALEHLNQDLDLSFAEENRRFDEYGLNFWCGEDSDARMGDEEVLDVSQEAAGLEDMLSGAGTYFLPSFSSASSSLFSEQDFLSVATSFGFAFSGSDDFRSILGRIEAFGGGSVS